MNVIKIMLTFTEAYIPINSLISCNKQLRIIDYDIYEHRYKEIVSKSPKATIGINI